jgi:hypothetical protein
MHVTLGAPNPMASAFVAALLAGAGAPPSDEDSTTSEAPSEIPPIGAIWPGQGGRNGGLMRGIDGGPNYWLILAEGAGSTAELEWGGYDEDDSGASSAHDGLANTKALIASEHDHPAAEFAGTARVEGKDDWYLPAIRECRLLSANVPELFESGYHWSSTQYSRDSAWVQYFVDGHQYYDDKNVERRVRLVRRLFL